MAWYGFGVLFYVIMCDLIILYFMWMSIKSLSLNIQLIWDREVYPEVLWVCNNIDIMTNIDNNDRILLKMLIAPNSHARKEEKQRGEVQGEDGRIWGEEEGDAAQPHFLTLWNFFKRNFN